MTITASLDERVAALELVISRLFEDVDGRMRMAAPVGAPRVLEPLARSELAVGTTVVVNLRLGGLFVGTVAQIDGDTVTVNAGRAGVVQASAERVVACPVAWLPFMGRER